MFTLFITCDGNSGICFRELSFRNRLEVEFKNKSLHFSYHSAAEILGMKRGPQRLILELTVSEFSGWDGGWCQWKR